MTSALAASTTASLFAGRARLFPDKLALADGRVRWSYGALAARVARLAGALRARDVAAGDRVAILSKNRAEYLEVLLACAWLGAIAAHQNWRLGAGELAQCLDLVEPRLVVASPELAPRVAPGRPAPLLFGADYEAAL